MEQLLTSNYESIKIKYNKALETVGRTDKVTFVHVVSTFGHVMQYYEILHTFVRTYISEEKSQFQKIFKAIRVIRDIFRDDMDKIVGDKNKYETAYNTYYKDPLNILKYYEGKVKESLQVILQGSRMHALFPADASANLNIGVGEIPTIVLSNNEMALKYVQLLITNVSYAVGENPDPQLEPYLPTQLLSDRDKCLPLMDTYKMIINHTFTFVSGYNSNTLTTANRETLNQFNEEYTLYQSKVELCLNDYIHTLTNLLSWKQTATKVTSEMLQEGPSEWYDFTQEIMLIDENSEEVIRVLNDFMLGIISKTDLFRSIVSDKGESLVGIKINSFVEKLKFQVSSKLKDLIESVKSDLKGLYLDMFRLASLLGIHLDQHHFYERAEKIVLWRIPHPNLQNPAQFQTDERELYQIWDRGTTLADFLSTDASKRLNEALNIYFQPLSDEIVSFEQQLTYHTDNLQAVLSTVLEQQQQLAKIKKIDQVFIS